MSGGRTTRRRRSWFPRLEEASVHTQPISEPGERHQFFKTYYQRGREVSVDVTVIMGNAGSDGNLGRKYVRR